MQSLAVEYLSNKQINKYNNRFPYKYRKTRASGRHDCPVKMRTMEIGSTLHQLRIKTITYFRPASWILEVGNCPLALRLVCCETSRPWSWKSSRILWHRWWWWDSASSSPFPKTITNSRNSLINAHGTHYMISAEEFLLRLRLCGIVDGS